MHFVIRYVRRLVICAGFLCIAVVVGCRVLRSAAHAPYLVGLAAGVLGSTAGAVKLLRRGVAVKDPRAIWIGVSTMERVGYDWLRTLVRDLHCFLVIAPAVTPSVLVVEVSRPARVRASGFVADEGMDAARASRRHIADEGREEEGKEAKLHAEGTHGRRTNDDNAGWSEYWYVHLLYVRALW